MLHVWWLLQHVSDVPEGDAWLSEAEREVLARFWAPKRIRDWRLGRWTAKQALLRAFATGCEVSDAETCAAITILADERGAPYATVQAAESQWAMSLSHSGEHGLCVVARRPAVVGCDIETIGRRGEEFVVDWFTAAERTFVDAIGVPEERSRAVTTVWSAKESALKALGVGLRLDTRDVEVELGGEPRLRAIGVRASDEWRPLAVHATDRSFQGWSRCCRDQILTMVAEPSPDVPIAL